VSDTIHPEKNFHNLEEKNILLVLHYHLID